MIGSKGSIQDQFMTILVLIGLVIAIAFSMVMINSYETKMNNVTGLEIPNETNRSIQQGKAAMTTWDNLVPFLFIGLSIAAITLAFMIPSHPSFFVFSFILLGFQILIAAIYSNIYIAMVKDEAFETAMDTLGGGLCGTVPCSVFVMTHAVEIILATGAAIILASYISSRFGGGDRV